MQIIFFDLETTGTNTKTSAVTQIGAIKDVGGEIKERFEILLKPHKDAEIDPKALEVTGITMEDLYENPNRVDHKKAYWEFMEFCGFKRNMRVYPSNRAFGAGYNILAFDNPVMHELGFRSGDLYSYAKFHWPVIDVASLAADFLRTDRAKMKNFKLATVAAELGIEVDNSRTHDAMYDIELTRTIYYVVRNKNGR